MKNKTVYLRPYKGTAISVYDDCVWAELNLAQNEDYPLSRPFDIFSLGHDEYGIVYWVSDVERGHEFDKDNPGLSDKMLKKCLGLSFPVWPDMLKIDQ